jgi:hypothetical protein
LKEIENKDTNVILDVLTKHFPQIVKASDFLVQKIARSSTNIFYFASSFFRKYFEIKNKKWKN